MIDNMSDLLKLAIGLILTLFTQDSWKTWKINTFQWFMGSLGFIILWIALIPSLYAYLEERFLEFTGQRAPTFLYSIWWESELAFAPVAVTIILSVGSILCLYQRLNFEDCEDVVAVMRQRNRKALCTIALLAITLSIYYIVAHMLLGDILH